MTNWTQNRKCKFNSKTGNKHNHQWKHTEDDNDNYSYSIRKQPQSLTYCNNKPSYQTEDNKPKNHYYYYGNYNTSQYHRYNNNNNNNYYYKEITDHCNPSTDYSTKFDIKESSSKYDYQDNVNHKNNKAKKGNGYKRNCNKEKRKTSQIILNNLNDINESNVHIDHLNREEILRVKIQLKDQIKEIIVYNNDEPYNVARTFVESNNLSPYFIHSLAVQFNTTILFINQLLNEKLMQNSIDLLNKLKLK